MDMKTKKIVTWFKLVCKGIRNEYEMGASHRNIEKDKTTLKDFLKEFKK